MPSSAFRGHSLTVPATPPTHTHTHILRRKELGVGVEQKQGLSRKERGAWPWVTDSGLRSFAIIWELCVTRYNLSDLACIPCKGSEEAICQH